MIALRCFLVAIFRKKVHIFYIAQFRNFFKPYNHHRTAFFPGENMGMGMSLSMRINETT